MAEELLWIRSGARGRQAKSKARVAAYEERAAEAERGRAADRFVSGAILIPPAPRLGDAVLDLRGVSLALGGRPLLADVSFSVPRGAIVGVIGGNGAGKSTLLRVIAGELAPDAGAVARGATVALGVVAQSRAALDADGRRVVDVVGDGADTVAVGGFDMPVRQYLAAFNLVGDLQTKPVAALSGGERNRVHLARTLRTPANLLLLDEPTNDLDVDTLRSLEEALHEYNGCAIVVSHDRFFLDRVASHMLVFHGQGRVEWFEGGYSAWAEEAAKGAGKGS
jgi:ATPase subunit of ABC transporter with duplicated ATPase domains